TGLNHEGHDDNEAHELIFRDRRRFRDLRGYRIARWVSRHPVYCCMRSDVTSMTRVSDTTATSRGAKTTRRPCVVAVVTIVLAESDVGLPNGPAASTSAIRPPTWTSSLRMPGSDSPSRPIPRV